MPPSPAFRCSPRRERGMENGHKRGSSFESGLLTVKVKDEDLTLFNDMHNTEQENFLLHTSDDFDDSILKLRYVPEIRIGGGVVVRRENNDLLNADGEKHDYDWLLTPPDTPLFSSLDDDEAQPANLLRRGRPRSQPVTVSRSSTVERDHRPSRSSASPRRLSPSPQSSNSLGQMRGRPSSAPRFSPPPVLRPATPSRRPSTPPSKPSATTLKSSTPVYRRNSTGSSGQASPSGTRGVSPARSSIGSVASPKLRGLEKNFEALSSDTPPNLRTSLSDRSTSHARGFSPTSRGVSPSPRGVSPSPRRLSPSPRGVSPSSRGLSPSSRGLSPSSRNGKDSFLKYGRRSMSPSGSASSSHSHEREQFSTYSRGSVASSGDDDVDSLQSAVGASANLAARKTVIGNNKAMSLIKKPSRTTTASSVPKRSFDSSLRQMDQRKIPQNMFRPLLSSVPATTFYGGKTNSLHRPMFSRNSSLTTSSTASSEQGPYVSVDVDAGDHDQNVLPGEWERRHDHDSVEEVFIFDKVDETNEDNVYELGPARSQNSDNEFAVGVANGVGQQECESPMGTFGDSASIATASEYSYADGNYSEVASYDMIVPCTECGKRFRSREMSANTNICLDCSKNGVLFSSEGPGIDSHVVHDKRIQSELAINMDTTSSGAQISAGMPKLTEESSSKVSFYQHGTENGLEIERSPLTNCLSSHSPLPVTDQKEKPQFDKQLDTLLVMNESHFHNENTSDQTENSGHPSLLADSSEGTGISLLLLKRSGSSKGPFVQGRAFSATNIVCSEPCYARDMTNAVKCNSGQDIVSASSVDLGSSWQTDLSAQSQKKCDGEKVTSKNVANSQCVLSHLEVPISVNEAAVCTRSQTDVGLSSFMEVVEYETFRESMLIPGERENSLQRENLTAAKSSSTRQAVDEDRPALADSCCALHTSESHLSSHREYTHLHDRLVTINLKDGECPYCVSAEEGLSRNSDRNMDDVEVSSDVLEFSVVEEGSVQDGIGASGPNNKYVDATRSSPVDISELENNRHNFQDLQTERLPSESPSNVETFHEQPASMESDKGVLDSGLESSIIDHAYGNHEEPTVTVEVPRGHMSRSLTLEEATDTILFCSSLIHDIAYKAANIGMEKESMLLEGSRPAVTIVGNYIPDQKEPRKPPVKNVPKSQKFKRKRLETHNKPPELENIPKVEEPTRPKPTYPNKLDSSKPPKLESKCNCTIM